MIGPSATGQATDPEIVRAIALEIAREIVPEQILVIVQTPVEIQTPTQDVTRPTLQTQHPRQTQAWRRHGVIE